MQTCLGAENVFNFFEVHLFQQRSRIKFSTILSEIYLSANIRQENKLVISALSYTQLFYSCDAAILSGVNVAKLGSVGNKCSYCVQSLRRQPSQSCARGIK